MSFLAKFTAKFLLAACTLISSVQAAVVTTGNIEPVSPDNWSASTTACIGKNDDGTLAVNGSDILYSGNSFLGFSQNATGTTTVSNVNSTWNTQALTIGFEGQGELNIIEGGKVSSAETVFGYEIRSTGTLSISDDGSSWENANDLVIGRFGNGYLNITDGGTASNQNCTIAFDSTAQGIVNVSGSGSTWDNTGELYVGNIGMGILNITDNGLVRITGALTIDANSNGDSSINITSGGMLALLGKADDSLPSFLNLVQGTDAIRYWDDSLNGWVPLTTGMLGADYTLEYVTENWLNGYTLLTIPNQAQNTIPGDANKDGVVNGSDITILADNWQVLSGATWEMGDFNGDGAVNGSDVTILASNWQVGAYATNTTAVPEPSMLLMLLFALSALGFVRHIK